MWGTKIGLAFTVFALVFTAQTGADGTDKKLKKKGSHLKESVKHEGDKLKKNGSHSMAAPEFETATVKVIDDVTGKAISKAHVKYFTQNWPLGKNVSTDSKGLAKIKSSNAYQTPIIVCSNGYHCKNYFAIANNQTTPMSIPLIQIEELQVRVLSTYNLNGIEGCRMKVQPLFGDAPKVTNDRVTDKYGFINATIQNHHKASGMLYQVTVTPPANLFNSLSQILQISQLHHQFTVLLSPTKENAISKQYSVSLSLESKGLPRLELVIYRVNTGDGGLQCYSNSEMSMCQEMTFLTAGMHSNMQGVRFVGKPKSGSTYMVLARHAGQPPFFPPISYADPILKISFNSTQQPTMISGRPISSDHSGEKNGNWLLLSKFDVVDNAPRNLEYPMHLSSHPLDHVQPHPEI